MRSFQLIVVALLMLAGAQAMARNVQVSSYKVSGNTVVVALTNYGNDSAVTRARVPVFLEGGRAEVQHTTSSTVEPGASVYLKAFFPGRIQVVGTITDCPDPILQ